MKRKGTFHAKCNEICSEYQSGVWARPFSFTDIVFFYTSSANIRDIYVNFNVFFVYEIKISINYYWLHWQKCRCFKLDLFSSNNIIMLKFYNGLAHSSRSISEHLYRYLSSYNPTWWHSTVIDSLLWTK